MNFQKSYNDTASASDRWFPLHSGQKVEDQAVKDKTTIGSVYSSFYKPTHIPLGVYQIKK